MPRTPPEVVWSSHAVDRGGERFGDCTQLTFPDEIIQAVGCCKQVGQTFKVGQAGVLYVCIKASETQIVVKTVYETEVFVDGGSRSNGKLGTDPHNRTIRRMLGAREKRSRASYKRECASFYIPGSSYRETGELDS